MQLRCLSYGHKWKERAVVLSLSTLLKLPRKQRKDTLTESVNVINLGVVPFILSLCLSHPNHDIYLDTKRSQRLPHYSLISKEFQSTLFLTSLDKATERKQKWLKFQDNMCQLSSFWLKQPCPQRIKSSIQKIIPKVVWIQVACQLHQTNSKSLNPYSLNS